jgi:hypothetical protein
MTRTSAGSVVDSGFNPSCSCNAMKNQKRRDTFVASTRPPRGRLSGALLSLDVFSLIVATSKVTGFRRAPSCAPGSMLHPVVGFRPTRRYIAISLFVGAQSIRVGSSLHTNMTKRRSTRTVARQRRYPVTARMHETMRRDIERLTEICEKLARESAANTRRCGELQRDIDALKKLLAQ